MMIVEWIFVWGILSCLVGPVIGGFMRFGLGDGRSAEPAPASRATSEPLVTVTRDRGQ